MSTRLAVIGDVGGHFASLAEQLSAVGVDVDSRAIPEGLTIVDVGDLIHRGPDSDAVVEFADAMMARNPGRWIQLAGNHESQYLDNGTDFWTPRVSAQSAATLRRWWTDGSMKVAAAFRLEPAYASTDLGFVPEPCDLLVTHAGLTAGAWRLLREPQDALEAADAINSAAASMGVAWREGLMITGVQDFAAGPMWAAGVEEVYASWFVHDAHELPSPSFAQAHGHTSPYLWSRRAWRPSMKALMAEGITASADSRRRMCRIEVGAHLFWAIDPAFGTTPGTVTSPLHFPSARPLHS